jgi:hypothetical protein
VYGSAGGASQVRIGDNSGSPSITFAGGARIQEIAGEIRLDTNTSVNANLTIAGVLNANGNSVIGNADTDTVGFYGDTGAARAGAIADAAGGAVIDAEARTAINALLAAMRATTGVGLITG